MGKLIKPGEIILPLEEHTQLQAQLAAAQARVKALEEAFSSVLGVDYMCDCNTCLHTVAVAQRALEVKP